MSFFEKHKWSYTYWHYDDTILSTPLGKKVLIRPHPVAVAGKTVSYGYDPAARKFDLVYEPDENCCEPTVIYVPGSPKSVEGGEYTSERSEEGTVKKLLFRSSGRTMHIKIKF